MEENNFCDRCGAVGKSRFVFPDGNDLVFCGHHTHEYEDTLMDLATDMFLSDELLVSA